MTTYICLLRGVNVGGRNELPMADLRRLFEALGYAEVNTYIQSGNVVFCAAGSVTPKNLEGEVHAHFALDVSVVLRTRSELRRVLQANPFVGVEPDKLHVGFMAHRAPMTWVTELEEGAFKPEEFVVRGAEVYLHLPNGMARTKLPAYLERRLQIPTTIRNWATVARLVELAGG